MASGTAGELNSIGMSRVQKDRARGRQLGLAQLVPRNPPLARLIASKPAAQTHATRLAHRNPRRPPFARAWSVKPGTGANRINQNTTGQQHGTIDDKPASNKPNAIGSPHPPLNAFPVYHVKLARLIPHAQPRPPPLLSIFLPRNWPSKGGSGKQLDHIRRPRRRPGGEVRPEEVCAWVSGDKQGVRKRRQSRVC